MVKKVVKPIENIRHEIDNDPAPFLLLLARLSTTGSTMKSSTVGLSLTASYASVCLGLVLLAVSFVVAVLTEGYAIRYIKSQFGIFSPCFDVMCIQSLSSHAAILTGVIVPLKYLSSPFLVFVSATVWSSISVAFVFRVLVASLKVRGASPFRCSRSALDRLYAFGLLDWVAPHSVNSPSRLFRLYTRCFYTLRTAKNLMVSAWRHAKLYAAMWTSFNDWRVVAFWRTVLTSTALHRVWVAFKGLAASYTRQSDFSRCISAALNVATFNRTSQVAATFQLKWVGKINLTANGAFTFDHDVIPYWSYLRGCEQAVRRALRMVHEATLSHTRELYHAV